MNQRHAVKSAVKKASLEDAFLRGERLYHDALEVEIDRRFRDLCACHPQVFHCDGKLWVLDPNVELPHYVQMEWLDQPHIYPEWVILVRSAQEAALRQAEKIAGVHLKRIRSENECYREQIAEHLAAIRKAQPSCTK